MDDYSNNPPNPMTEIAIESATGIVEVKFAAGIVPTAVTYQITVRLFTATRESGCLISLTALLACDRGP